MKSRLLVLVVVSVFLILPFALAGQDKKDAAGTTSITGCFNKGAEADRYVIKDEKTGKETVVTGDAAMLARHANNHKVTITGNIEKQNDKEILKATNLQMLALCQ